MHFLIKNHFFLNNIFGFLVLFITLFILKNYEYYKNLTF